jgi:actin
VVRDAVTRLNFGGADLTALLQEIIGERGYSFTTFTEREIVRDIKEKRAYVTLDLEAELRKATTTRDCHSTYTLPDGRDFVIASERFRCPELLFKPWLFGFSFDGIDRTLFDSIMKCEADLHKDLYANIMLTGGTSLFTGLLERIENEIVRLAPPTAKINLRASPDRYYAAWIGGSIFLPSQPSRSSSSSARNTTTPGPGLSTAGACSKPARLQISCQQIAG